MTPITFSTRITCKKVEKGRSKGGEHCLVKGNSVFKVEKPRGANGKT